MSNGSAASAAATSGSSGAQVVPVMAPSWRASPVPAAPDGRRGETSAMSCFVLFYESADDVLSKAPAVFPAHHEHVVEFHRRGELLLVGTFADPQADGSMAVFTTREAAEAFVAGDPFVRDGVVRSWTIKEWHESSATL